MGQAFDTSAGEGGVALGLFAGALTFFVGDTVIARMGGSDRNPATPAAIPTRPGNPG